MKALTILLFTSVLFLSGCNTISGMGQDIEAGGEKIQDASSDVKKKL